MPHWSLRHLSDDAVSQELAAATSGDRKATAAHLARIAEFDRRRLYLAASCSSTYRYCVDRLHMSEDIAFHRIRAARVARLFPQVYAAVADGRLNVTAVSLLFKHITRKNGAELLAAAANRSKKQVLLLLAEQFGPPAPVQPPAGVPAISLSPALVRVTEEQPPALVRVTEEQPPALVRVTEEQPPALVRVTEEQPPALVRVTEEQPPALVRVASSDGAADAGSRVPVTARGAETQPLPLRATLEPVAQGRWELVAVLDQDTHDQLVAAQELLGHAIPSGALVEVLRRAIALQHAQLRKRRCGATERPRTSANANGAAPRHGANPRHVPAADRRAVWERDGGQCAFVGTDGHRCQERSRVELDHIVPLARGGRSTVSNLRLLCSAHNQYAAERELGRQHVEGRREAAQRLRAAERYYKQADRERTEKRKAEIARQREELGEAFRMLGYRGAELERALACCATRPEAPLEERLKYALGCMAPNARREAPAPGRETTGWAEGVPVP